MKLKTYILNKIGQGLRKLRIRPSKSSISMYLFRVLGPFVGDLSVEVEGLCLTGSFWHRRELWKLQEGRYERFTVKLFQQVLAPGMVVLDIGAHIGLYSLLAAQQVGPEGRVYAFEPDPRTFPYLVRNIEQNGLSGIIVPVEIAISDQKGILRLNLDKVTSGDTSLFRRNTTGRIIGVQSVRLDDFLPDQTRVDIVKLDIEGGEVRALEGMEHILTRNNNIKIFAECNPSMLQSAGSSVKELLQKLSSQGFEVRVINDEVERLETAELEKILRMASDAKTPTWAINLYCSKKGIGNG